MRSMAEQPPHSTEDLAESPRYETDEHADKRFQGWRLLGIIAVIIVGVAVASALVDWAVIGPLKGRAY